LSTIAIDFAISSYLTKCSHIRCVVHLYDCLLIDGIVAKFEMSEKLMFTWVNF